TWIEGQHFLEFFFGTSEIPLLKGLLAGAKGLLDLGFGGLRGHATRNNRRDSKEEGKTHVRFSKSRAKRGEILRCATRRTSFSSGKKGVRRKRPGRSAQNDRGGRRVYCILSNGERGE